MSQSNAQSQNKSEEKDSVTATETEENTIEENDLQLLQCNQIMVNEKYTNEEKNKLKIKLYDYDVTKAMKYYSNDSFCILGSINDCVNKKHKQIHLNEINFNVFSLISLKKYNQALNILNYLAYYFENIINSPKSYNHNYSYNVNDLHIKIILIYEIYYIILFKHLKQITLDQNYI